MLHTRWCLALAALIAASASGAPVTLHDATAHASGQKMTDARTITDMSLDSGGGKLSVSASLAGPSFIRVLGQPAVVTGNVMMLGIDADNNDRTGADAHFVSGVKGLESQIDVAVCANEKAKGGTSKSHCINGFWGNNLAGASAEAKPAGHSSAARTPIASMRIAAPGKKLSIQLPYSPLGVAAGKTIRVYVLGWRGGSFGLLFGPVTMTLQ